MSHDFEKKYLSVRRSIRSRTLDVVLFPLAASGVPYRFDDHHDGATLSFSVAEHREKASAAIACVR